MSAATAHSFGAILATLFVDLAWKASVIVIAAALVAATIRRNAAARDAVWTAAAFGLLLLPLMTFLVPRRPTGGVLSPLADLAAAAGGIVPFRLGAGEALVVGPGGAALAGTVAAADIAGVAEAARAVPAWVMLLLLLCLAGALIEAVRLVRAHHRQRLILSRARHPSPALRLILEATAGRLGLTRIPLLVLADHSLTPMLAGIRRPCVILPAGWSAPTSTTRLVLLHELAHVRRLDMLRQLAVEWVRALYCWHPAAWWLASRAAIDREIAADQMAVAAGADPVAYARMLIAEARAGQRRRTALHLSRTGSLEQRVRQLLRPGSPVTSASRFVPAVLLIGTLGLAGIWPSGNHRRAPTAAAASDVSVQRVQLPVHTGPPTLRPIHSAPPAPRAERTADR
jgi:beta-lactamase regulating signal transducer with metallopeptidase domain